MSPIRRIISSILGLSMLLAGSYMFYGLFFLGFGAKFWMIVASGLGIFFGGYFIWADGIAPSLSSRRDKE